jgi:hypothetical protein
LRDPHFIFSKSCPHSLFAALTTVATLSPPPLASIDASAPRCPGVLAVVAATLDAPFVGALAPHPQCPDVPSPALGILTTEARRKEGMRGRRREEKKQEKLKKISM